jgi:hypothetical protein
VADRRKKAVSVRLAADDLVAVRQVAARFEVNESDVIRFAVKSALALLAPLRDNDALGRDVLPAFLELGGDLCRHFGLDERRLNHIVNGKPHQQHGKHLVGIDDLRLLTMMSPRGSDAVLRSLNGHLAPDLHADLQTSASTRVRKYLYGKYFVDSTAPQ